MLDADLAAARRVRRTDPGTSYEAAVRAAPRAAALQDIILQYLGGQTEPRGAEEIGLAIGVAPYEVRKRLSELRDTFCIRPVGERRTSSGRTERTWELVP